MTENGVAMRGKILIVTGLAVGYVLGARAGRERYEEIKRAASKFWNNPRVKEQVERVEDFAKDKAPEVVGFLSDNAKKVVAQVTSKKATSRKATAGSTPRTSPARASKASSSAKSTGTGSSSTTK